MLFFVIQNTQINLIVEIAEIYTNKNEVQRRMLDQLTKVGNSIIPNRMGYVLLKYRRNASSLRTLMIFNNFVFKHLTN